jgi:hypothetical protein
MRVFLLKNSRKKKKNLSFFSLSIKEGGGMTNVTVKSLVVQEDFQFQDTCRVGKTISSVCGCATSGVPNSPLSPNVEFDIPFTGPAITGTSIAWDAGSPTEFVAQRGGHYIIHLNVALSYTSAQPDIIARIKIDGVTVAAQNTFQSILINSAKRLNCTTGAHVNEGQVMTVSVESTAAHSVGGTYGCARLFIQRSS